MAFKKEKWLVQDSAAAQDLEERKNSRRVRHDGREQSVEISRLVFALSIPVTVTGRLFNLNPSPHCFPPNFLPFVSKNHATTSTQTRLQ